MFIQDDNTYNNLREKSFLQWLDDCSKHEDIAVRGGVKLAYEYVEMLNNEIKSRHSRVFVRIRSRRLSSFVTP